MGNQLILFKHTSDNNVPQILLYIEICLLNPNELIIPLDSNLSRIQHVGSWNTK